MSRILFCSLAFFLLTHALKGNCQVVIYGKVTGSIGTIVANASIIYREKKNTEIAGFALSDSKGQYSLEVTSKSDSIIIEINYVGYAKQSFILKNISQQKDFVLIEQVNTLKEVKVKNSPVYESRDTINYDVKAFAAAQDRVLRDALKKMPGIDVRPNGQINYQGNPIQQLTVNGLNLMEGRYGLITNNIPLDAVSRVQVVEDDQPIKILDSLMPSNRTSINIKLKKFATTGSAELGAGFSPVLRQVNITPMFFNKSFQALQSFMSNNTGIDGGSQLRKFSSGSGLDNNEGISDLVSSAGLVGTPTPPFDKEKWLNNNINLLASNTLQKFHHEWELKTNLGYVNDFQQQLGASQTDIFTGTSKIHLSENKQNTYNNNTLFGGLIIGKNTKKVYLRNNFSVEKKFNNTIGYLDNDSAVIYQNYNQQHFKLDNRLTLTTQWGKQLLNINSQTNYASLPEDLSVTPGVFPFLLNNDSSYHETAEQVYAQSFSTSNTVSLIKKLRKFVIAPKFGIFYNHNSLTSGMKIQNHNISYDLDSRFTNNVKLRQMGASAELQMSYEIKNWIFKINAPASISHYSVTNDSSYSKRVFIFQPRGLAEYSINDAFKMNYTFFRTDNYGDIKNLYEGYILSNYRTIQKQSAVFPESIGYNHTFGVEYKDITNSFFVSFNASYSLLNKNILYNTSVDPAGAISASIFLRDNRIESKGLYASISKFVSGLKTVVKLDGDVNLTSSEQLINGALISMNSKNTSLHTTLDGNFFKYIIPSYEARVTFTHTDIGGGSTQYIQQQDHHLELNIFPDDKNLFTVKGDYYTSNLPWQQNSFFMNVSYRHKLKFKQKNGDIEIRCNNLANTKYYYSFYNTAYINVTNSFQLRERQLLIVFHCAL